MRHSVPGGYVLDARKLVKFQVASYNPNYPLIIDPLVYSTYVSGSLGEDGEGITVDSAGNAYVTGAVASGDFPTTPGAFQRVLGNAVGGTDPEEDCFVLKLNPSGTALVYSTYLGGDGNDQGNAVVVDAAGNAYIAGKSESKNFPTTPGAYQSAPGLTSAGVAILNGFVAKLNPSGTALIYSTYLHKAIGSTIYATQMIGLGVLGGNAYVAGNAEQTPGIDVSDGFAAEVNATGTALIYSYTLGGSKDDEVENLFLDAGGNAYIAGETSSTDFPVTTGAYQTALGGGMDGFITKLNPAGTAAIFSTFVGGSGDDTVEDVATDAAGSIYATGQTTGGFPTTAGAYRTTTFGGVDIYVIKLDSAGAKVVYSTYIGGTNTDHPDALAIDSSGNVILTGDTASTDFPVTPDAFQKTFGGGATGEGDAFILKLNSTGTALMYSSYLGGSGDDYADAIALDSAGNAYITGATASSNFPVTAGSFHTTCGTDSKCNGTFNDAFVTKVDVTAGVAAAISAVSGGNQTGTPGTHLPNPLIVKVLDGRGAPVIGAPVTVTAANANVSPVSGLTDFTGIFSTLVTLGGALGPASVKVSTGGASATFPFGSQLVNITAVVNGASFTTTIQDGSWTSILGSNLSSTTRIFNTQTEIINGVLPLSLDGVSVTIDGKSAPMYFISPTQLNVLTPITGKIGPVTVVVKNSVRTAMATAAAAKYSPGLFLFDPMGHKYPAALIARTDGGVDYLGPSGLFGAALATRPAKPGEIVELYGTGLGPTNPPVPVGSVFGGAASVDPAGAVTTTIGGVTAPVLFAGITGAGLYQVNVVVPTVPDGDQKVVLTVSGLSTPDNVFVAVMK